MASAGDTEITVTWTVPTASATETAPEGYEVCYGVTGGTALDSSTLFAACNAASTLVTITAVSGATTATETITGLSNTVPYLVAVRATHSSSGDGGWVATTPAMVTPRPPAMVGDPVSPMVTPGDTSIAVSWRAPASSVTVLVPDGYEICYALNSNYNNIDDLGVACNDNADTIFRVAASGTSASLTGLTNAAVYRVAIRATHSSGDGAWVATAPATVTPMAAATTDPPTAVTATPGDEQIGLSWTAPSDTTGLSEYVVCWVNEADIAEAANAEAECTANVAGGGFGGFNATTATVAVGTTTRTLASTDLDGAASNSNSYFVFVQANYAAGRSTWAAADGNPISPSATPPPAPGVPRNVMGKQFAAGAVTVPTVGATWNAPDGGTTPTGYEICVRPNTASPNYATECTTAGRTVTATADARMRDITDAEVPGITLVYGRPYLVGVRATHSSGNGNWVGSDRTSFSTEPPPPPLPRPNKPTAFTATQAAGSLDVNLAWTLADGADAQITEWELIIVTGSGANAMNHTLDLAPGAPTASGDNYTYTLPAGLSAGGITPRPHAGLHAPASWRGIPLHHLRQQPVRRRHH